MNHLKKTNIIPLAGALLFFGLSLAFSGSAATEGCVAAKCHAGMLKNKTIHPVAEPCDTCHQSITTPHPQNKKKTFKLTEEVPGLCFQCHSRFGALKHTHAPVKDGMCTTCHDPHDSAQPKLLTQSVKDLCTSCHPDKIDFPFVHGPAATGDCTSCHNPHESNNSHLVIKAGADLCFTCHVEMQGEIKKKVVHPALKNGCTSCHNPHGSAVKKFFAAAGSGLCFQCHPQIEDKLKSAKKVHSPVKTERGCAACHAPHASDAPKLLAKAGKDLCLDCHKDFIKKTQTVLHGPIRDGKCTPCHDPHGTPNDRLLIKPYSTEFYVSYTDNEFPLCFSCHNRDLLRFPTTSFATGFRDGDKNLHYIHVNRKDRGKSCKVCHAVHAGENPKLIADKVPFGKWSLPLNFVKTETGGSCSPGCHQKYVYDRKTPGKEAKQEKTPESEKSTPKSN
jgi:predicted CXXCH cytochrome family protein